jgi:hypothetical protein
MKRILVTGSRDWHSFKAVKVALEDAAAGERIVVIHGGCPTGADSYAGAVARDHGWRVEINHADWKRYGHGAGPLRNADMVRAGADLCLAFIRNNSDGASGCARLAEDAGIPVIRLFEASP